ncbi:MAG TPA: cell division protein FtsZ, partial [Albitalea sp.]|nr:cell division protein FtsZ [Albitalea sp.]
MTSSLTLALAALGGVVLAGVVAHGAWQARKAGPKRAAPTLSREEPREPVLVNESGESSPVASFEPRALARASARLDALIDAIAPLTVEAPISGEMVLMHQPATRRAGSKPFMIEGLNAETGEWETALPGQRYGEFQAGVQLANRTGALNEIEYSEFVQKIEAFAEAIGAMADFPDMLDVVARARELDAFASEHDAQLAVHLQARSAAWSVGYIQQHAARHGFVPGAVPGRLVLPSSEEGAPPVLTLSFDSQAALADDPNRSAVRDVTLSFDVPQTDPQVDPFVAWQASAQALALGMDAGIVDDNGRALSPEGFAAIGGELGELYRT